MPVRSMPVAAAWAEDVLRILAHPPATRTKTIWSFTLRHHWAVFHKVVWGPTPKTTDAIGRLVGTGWLLHNPCR